MCGLRVLEYRVSGFSVCFYTRAGVFVSIYRCNHIPFLLTEKKIRDEINDLGTCTPAELFRDCTAPISLQRTSGFIGLFSET